MFWLFILAVIAQCAYALCFFARAFFLSSGKLSSGGKAVPVSIIICAKNESANLKKNLPVVLSQKYAGVYEVIVVNDDSTDDTAETLRILEQRYDNLWDIVIGQNAERNLTGKKFALSKGIIHAKYDWLLLTDADCAPNSDKWLELMAAPLAAGKEIVAGYGGYKEGPGLLNAFTRWETLHTFTQYSTYALAGLPYMAVGRNMACARQVLQTAQQGELWNKLPSGDDDLLVSIMGNASNTAVMADKQAFTYTDAKQGWTEWAKQKQRHLSTGKYYKTEIKLLLSCYAVSHAVMWLCFFFLLATAYWKTAINIMCLRCVLYWALWLVMATRINEKKLIFWFPFFDIGWMIYNFAFLPYITWKNKKHWK